MNELQQTIDELRHYCSGYQLELLQEIERLTQPSKDIKGELIELIINETRNSYFEAEETVDCILNGFILLERIEDEPCECCNHV